MTDWSGELNVVEYCTRWKATGHQLKPKAAVVSGPEAEEVKVKRREVIENLSAA